MYPSSLSFCSCSLVVVLDGTVVVVREKYPLAWLFVRVALVTKVSPVGTQETHSIIRVSGFAPEESRFVSR